MRFANHWQTRRPHVCSVSINLTFHEGLTLLNDKGSIENKLLKFASEANPTQSGALDTPDCLLHDWPADLKHVRRKRFGRHRVFFVGHHKQCSYHAFYLKTFKQKGKEDENDKSLHKRLGPILNEPVKRKLGESEKEKP